MGDENISINSYDGYHGQVDNIESIAKELEAEVTKQKGIVEAALKADLTSFTAGGQVAPCYAPISEVVTPYMDKVFGNATAAAQSGLASTTTLRNAANGIHQLDLSSAEKIQSVGNPNVGQL